MVFSRHSMAVTTLKSYAMAKFGEVELGAVVSHRGRVHLSESLESNLFTDTISQTCTDAREEGAPELDSDHRESDWSFINNSKTAVLSFLSHNPCFSGV